MEEEEEEESWSYPCVEKLKQRDRRGYLRDFSRATLFYLKYFFVSFLCFSLSLSLSPLRALDRMFFTSLGPRSLEGIRGTLLIVARLIMLASLRLCG